LESVHLIDWPQNEVLGSSSEVLENMQKVREIVSLGLEARQKAGIKVRQPLNQLRITNYELQMEYVDLIKEELNVKEIILEPRTSNLEPNVELDTKITSELKEEGKYRELVRAIQDMRKNMGLTPSDIISLIIETNDIGQKLIQKFEKDLLKVVLASKIGFKENDGEEIKIDGLVFKIKIEK